MLRSCVLGLADWIERLHLFCFEPELERPTDRPFGIWNLDSICLAITLNHGQPFPSVLITPLFRPIIPLKFLPDIRL